MNPAVSHPDFPQENQTLGQMLAFIQTELAYTRKEEAEAFAEFDDLFRHSGGVYSNELLLAGARHRRAKQQRIGLELAALTPYFTRVDFRPEDTAQADTYYIGKNGVIDHKTQDPVIVDWRSPVANLYYSGQLGPVSYHAPDGDIQGDLSLKRQLGIENSELVSIFDTEVVSRDVYLQAVLGQRSTDRLRDIVSTIQREQNDVIRAPKDRPLIAQGAAGAGKTTIALHRIAYLLYTHRETMQSKNMLILAPSPLFLDYISAVLPELGADDVAQMTFEQLCLGMLGTKAPRVMPDNKLERMLEMDEEQAVALGRASGLKGSPEFKQACLDYLRMRERTLLPQEEVRLGPVLLYTAEQLQSLFLTDLAPFPIMRRLKDIGTQITLKAKDACAAIVHALDAECQRRVIRMKNGIPEGPFLRKKLTALYDARDERTKQIRDQAKTYGKAILKEWPSPSLMEWYTDFWQQDAPEGVDAQAWRDAQAQTLPLLEKKRCEWEDLAALVTFQQMIAGLSDKLDIHHTVVDEAQDLSFFQFDLLQRLAGSTSLTLVGDVAQGIHGYRGVQGWEQTAGAALPGKLPQYLTLTTSYRSTMPIMHFAAKIARHFPPPKHQDAQPVLREGPAPMLVQVEDEAHRASAIAQQIADLKAEGFKTIGVVELTGPRAAALHKRLAKLGVEGHLITADDSAYHGGISVLPVALSKGLEFDGVIVADASDAVYPYTQLHCRLLYVACTRPLHRLSLFYTQAPSKLLEQPQGEEPETA